MKVGDIKDSKFNGQMQITGINKKNNTIMVRFTDGLEVETTYQKFVDDDVRVSIHQITEQTYDLATALFFPKEAKRIGELARFTPLTTGRNSRLSAITEQVRFLLCSRMELS